MPGIIAVVQTAGDALSFNPHVHMIATQHCLGPSGRLYRVPYIPYVKLSRIWKIAVLNLLKNTKCIDRNEYQLLWTKYRHGFNLNGEIEDGAKNRKTTQRLAQYLVRPWMAESRMVADDAPCKRVIFRARGAKDKKTGRRPPIRRSMSAAEFVAKLLVQIPPKGQKLVNYYGLYSNKVRGKWKKFGYRPKTRSRHRSPGGWLDWRTHIWKVYEADPLACPACGEELILVDLVMPEEAARLDSS